MADVARRGDESDTRVIEVMVAYLERGQLEEAIAEYERILRLNPNYPLVHYHLAIPEVLAAKEQLNKQS